MTVAFVQSAIYLVSAWIVMRSRSSNVTLLITVAFAIIFRLSILFAPSYLSDDIYRYVWDGRVQAAGINPYRYIPAAPELAQLRDDAIYPKINRKDWAHTIYPPVAQVVFLLTTRISESVTWMKATMLGFELVTIWAVAQLLALLGRPRQLLLIYAWHPDGFALHSMRSESVSRLYLQVPNDTPVSEWPDDRIWEALATRLGHGQDGWTLTPGPITEKSVLPMHSFVQSPMRHGRLFLAGDAAHIVPPTGAKGLNLAVADVGLLAPALAELLLKGDARLADAYSDTALRRVWRCTHFSWWMTTMLHQSGDPFERELQLSQLRWVTSSEAGATGLAENYAGLPIGF